MKSKPGWTEECVGVVLGGEMLIVSCYNVYLIYSDINLNNETDFFSDY